MVQGWRSAKYYQKAIFRKLDNLVYKNGKANPTGLAFYLNRLSGEWL